MRGSPASGRSPTRTPRSRPHRGGSGRHPPRDLLLVQAGRAAGLDEQQVRQRAFRALRALLWRIGSRKPVLWFVDDLEWGDADSAEQARRQSALEVAAEQYAIARRDAEATPAAVRFRIAEEAGETLMLLARYDEADEQLANAAELAPTRRAEYSATPHSRHERRAVSSSRNRLDGTWRLHAG